MKNIIPKKLKNSKYKFWRNLTITDFIIILIWIFLSIIFIFWLKIKLFIKLIILIIKILFIFPLIIKNKKTYLKGWEFLYFKIIFLFSYKKYKKNKTYLLVPYNKIINNNYISTNNNFKKINNNNNDDNLIGVIKIKGFDFTLLNYEQQILKLKNLQYIFKTTNFPITFLKIELPLNFSDNIKFLKKKLEKFKKKDSNNFNNIIFQIKNNISFLKKEIFKNNNEIKMEKCFFLFVYGNNIQDINEKIIILKNKLYNCKFSCEILSNYEIVKILKWIWNPFEKPINKKYFEKNKKDLKKILKFNYLKFNKNYFIADNLYYSLNIIEEYPLLINDLWGACLFKNKQTVIWNINPLNNNETNKLIDNAIKNTELKKLMTKSNIYNNADDYELDVYFQLINEINREGELLKNNNILFLNYGQNKKKLIQSQNKLIKSLKEMKIKINQMLFRQFESFKSFLPFNYEKLIEKYGQEIPTNTLAASFPFINNNLNDKEGMYIGTDNLNNNPIFWNQFKINNKRINHNMIIIGTSGSGKTFFIKKNINHHIKIGRKIIIIDPEREYKEICKYYNGDWIDINDGSLCKINPLQILDNNFISNNDVNINTSPLSNHLRFLEQWFKTLYPNFNEREMNILIKYLKLLYINFNITNNTKINEIKNICFPTITDFCNLLNQEFKKNKNKILEEFLNLFLTDFLDNGKYQNLWNGHTTINFKNNLIVCDVYNLFDLDNKKTNSAQLILILNFIKKEIKKNRFENNNEIVIIIDEAHLAIDEDNPIALNFIYQMSKRIRKYNGALIISTQNIADFFENENILKKTTAIINNSQYSLIMGLKPNDLQKVVDLYKIYGGLTSIEKEYILRNIKGQGLFFISNFERYRIKIKLYKNEKNSF